MTSTGPRDERVVVAGGTGFLGRHITRALLEAGLDVAVLSRSPDKLAREPGFEEITPISADVTEPVSLAGTLRGARTIVSAAQFPNHPIEVPRRGLTYDRYDRRGNENLLIEAANSGVERFVYLSGVGADPRSDKTWFRAKGRAEKKIRESDLSHAIVRPSWAYGRGDRALNRYVTMARFSPVIPQLGARPQRIQPVAADDIALAVRRILERDEAWDRTYEIGGPEVMTMNEVIRTLLEVIGRKRPVVPVPAWLAKAGTAPLIALPSPPMSPQAVEFAIQDGLADNTDVEKILDVHPVPLREGLRRYLS